MIGLSLLFLNLLNSSCPEVNSTFIVTFSGYYCMNFLYLLDNLYLIFLVYISILVRIPGKSPPFKVPLCFAAANNHVECLRFLLKHKHDTHQLMDDRKFVFDLMVTLVFSIQFSQFIPCTLKKIHIKDTAQKAWTTYTKNIKCFLFRVLAGICLLQ